MEFGTKIGVVVIDSHVSTREMLARELAGAGRYRVVGGASTGLEAMKVCRENNPDLVVLELFLSGMDGVELVRGLRRSHPRARFLIYTGVRSKDLIADMLRERPDGFVRKQDSLATFLEGVRVVCAGGSFFTEFAASQLAHAQLARKPAALTTRERLVLQLVAEGMRSKEIADQLNISLKTAEHHRANLMDKLGIHDVASLTCYAIRRGYVEFEAFG